MAVDDAEEIEVTASSDDPSDTETTVSVNGPSSPSESESREDEIEDDRAYFAPRVVPKAALPSETEAAKVVINVPGAGDEVTQAIDKRALLAEKAREEQAARARRREPTVRIERKQVDAVRAQIAAAERASGAAPEIPVFFDSQSNGDASASSSVVRSDAVGVGAGVGVGASGAASASAAAPGGRAARAGGDDALRDARSGDSMRAYAGHDDDALEPPRSGASKVGVVAVLLLALGGVGGATWYFTQRTTPSASDATGPTAASSTSLSSPQSSPQGTSTTTAATAGDASAPAASTPSDAPSVAAPPVELSATPTSDPSVVTLNSAAAQAGKTPPHTWQPPTGATYHPPTTAPGTAAHPPTKPGTGKLPTKPSKPGIPSEI